MAASDEDSSGSEIPFKKPNQQQEPRNQENDAGNSEDEEEDEYVVESVTAHRFTKKGALEFRVKWEGFSDKESTWEPEENLEGAPDELEAYFSEIGGRPQRNKATSKAEPAAKRRKLSENGRASDPSPPTSSAKKGPTSAKSEIAPGRKQLSTPDDYPSGSWEDKILNIDTMTREGDKIKVWVIWKNGGIKSKHDTAVVYAKAPQKCLQFYESHLQFNTYPPKPQETTLEHRTVVKKDSSPIAHKQSPEEAYESQEEDVGVKKVASAV